MQGKIHVLDEIVINKIAAGEVVERPASIIKELVENSLDAGATSINIELEEGGIKSLVIKDNGSGIGIEDAKLVLRRHATSKIKNVDDLFAVESMGFRGEALASIASVSKLRICSATKDAVEGFELTQTTETDCDVHPWRGDIGTTVIVEDLFYNVPARRKFLKSNAAEYAACHELLNALALARPDIHFRLAHNGKERLNTFAVTSDMHIPGRAWGKANLIGRFKQIIDDSPTSDSMMYVTGRNQYLSMEALISPPGIEKGSGKGLFSFVNGRWVKDRMLRAAILRGYHSHLLRGRFPQVVLHCTIDPSLVDVNVHPHKTELRFQYAREIQDLIAHTIRKAIRQGAWAAPAETSAEQEGFADSFSPLFMPRKSSSVSLSQGISSWARHGQSTIKLPTIGHNTFEIPTEKESVSLEKTNASDSIPWNDLKYVGCYAACYLMFEADGRLLSIDQHAFHERVLYERLVKNRDLVCQAQPLLVPEEVRLAPTEVAHLQTHREALKSLGFEFDITDNGTLEVTSVPSLLAGRPLEELILALADPLQNEHSQSGQVVDGENYMHYTLSTLACHSAVRAGEELPHDDLKLLLSEAQKVDFYHNCPHGRRVFKWWSQAQVAAWFDR